MSFANAPVSKAGIYTLGIGTFLAGAFKKKHYLHLPLHPHLVRDHQWWRFVVHELAFANSVELFVGVLLLWQAAIVVERATGSAKFASYLLAAWAIASLVNLFALLILARPFELQALPAGPFDLLFASIYQYWKIIPPLYRFSLFGLQLTDKSFAYLLAVQLVSCQPPTSFVPSIAGLVAGAVATSFVQRPFLPSIVLRLAVRFIIPLLGSSHGGLPPTRALIVPAPSDVRTARASGTSQAATTEQARGSVRNILDTFASARADPSSSPMNEDHVQSLLAMFPARTDTEVRDTLRQTNNNLERAVEILLARDDS
ncbi:uncharacterized protein L969DRAFT_134706 [Mixia osmundae IAM 14324]|uniref:CUE domain-containing protein n=1 Tax=Mixia osmundae (strain CBS 9802 / IAM 14324 / JCM 22182 / KY 12970) TaxID=764103 RepID=G7E038_MIXOS|nr:uncharacterized protein L969DRAFT_134706 [Mixia osmundae IAM 14324]KEI42190.1 hypothetical protein L969DRAFT_134706 [Mixia osmundae IAM 14324]GAA96198.1 hypothetical protein E5Q_02862 [Mixia osmundae IAM 14324]